MAWFDEGTILGADIVLMFAENIAIWSDWWGEMTQPRCMFLKKTIIFKKEEIFVEKSVFSNVYPLICVVLNVFLESVLGHCSYKALWVH